MMRKHILKAEQFTPDLCDKIFSIADKIKQQPWGYADSLSGRLMGTLFFEPSLRTRFSFETAMARMGGSTVSAEHALASTSSAKGESLRDTVKVVSQYVDTLVIRHHQNELIEEVASYSEVPVINAGSGHMSHPTQALLDLYTIKSYFRRLKGLNVLFVGDLIASRTARSLLKVLEQHETNNILASSQAIDDLDKRSNRIDEERVRDIIEDVDVVYMTRHQKERDVARRRSSFIMTAELADKMKKNAIIMHPLPRTEELPQEVDANHRAVYFKQAKNGMFVRMGLLWHILKM